MDELAVDKIVEWVTLVVTVASMIAAATPTPRDDKFISIVYKLIDLLAINVGKAKDKGND